MIFRLILSLVSIFYFLFSPISFLPPPPSLLPPPSCSSSYSSVAEDENPYDPVDLGDGDDVPMIPKSDNKKPKYDDMSPAMDDDDYLDPTESTYLNPVDQHPTIV